MTETAGKVFDTAIASEEFSELELQKLCCFYRSGSVRADCIDVYGTTSFFDDAGIEPTDPAALVFAYYCGCTTQGIFSIDEFYRGCTELKIDSREKVKALIPELRWEILDLDICRLIYMFTFSFCVENDEKTLACGVCCQYWKMLLEPHFYRFDEWIQFIETTRPDPISKDTWKFVFEFCANFDKIVEEYDPGGAWPILIDDFVLWYNDRQLKITSTT